MGEFRVGDKVRIPKYNAYGTIVDIDREWAFPYEVEIENKAEDVEYDELFTDTELELIPKKVIPIELVELKGVVDTLPRKEKVLNINDIIAIPKNQYIYIKFQEGAIQENGVNGTQIEDVINVLIERLEGFQKGDFSCRENALAITKLEEARMWLNERTRKRKEKGIEGLDINHE